MGNGCCQAKNLDKDSETVFKINQPTSTTQNGQSASESTKSEALVTAGAPQPMKSDYTPLTVTSTPTKTEVVRVIGASTSAGNVFTTGYTSYTNPTGGYYYSPVGHVVQTSLPQGTITTTTSTVAPHGAVQLQTQSYNPLQQRGLFSSGQKGIS